MIEAEAGRAKAVQCGQGAAQPFVEIGPASRGRDSLKHEKRVAHGQHLGNAQRTRLGQPGQTARLGREHGRIRHEVTLDEHHSPVSQGHLVRAVDVTAGHRARRSHRAAQGARHRFLQFPSGHQESLCVRRK